MAYFVRFELFEDGGASAAAFTATRTSTSGEFATFGRMSAAPPVLDGAPSVTADGRSFMYSRGEPATGLAVIMRGTLSTQGVGFLGATKMTGPVNEGSSQSDPYVLPDGTAFYFASERGGLPPRIYRASLTPSGDAPSITVVDGLEPRKDSRDSAPVVTPDELTIYWARGTDGSMTQDIYVATRADKASPFSAKRAVSELNAADRSEVPTFITADGCRVYFSKFHSGAHHEGDILVATKPH